MKIRSGFVSNSSSASFIINTRLTLTEFTKLLSENSDTFDVSEIKYKLEKVKYDYGKKFREEILGLIKTETKTLKNGFTYTNHVVDNMEEFLTKYLKSRGIHVIENQDDYTVTVENNITMLNQYGDFNKLIKEIVFLLTCANKDFRIEIEED